MTTLFNNSENIMDEVFYTDFVQVGGHGLLERFNLKTLTCCRECLSPNPEDCNHVELPDMNSFFCRICRKAFDTKLKLEKHLQSRHDNEELCCDYCFDSREKFNQPVVVGTQDELRRHFLETCPDFPREEFFKRSVVPTWKESETKEETMDQKEILAKNKNCDNFCENKLCVRMKCLGVNLDW